MSHFFAIPLRMETKELKEYIEEEAQKTHHVQARINPKLKQQMDKLCKENGWKESYVIRGGIQKFIDECSERVPF